MYKVTIFILSSYIPTSLIKIAHKIHIVCRTIEWSHNCLKIRSKTRDPTIFVLCNFVEDQKVFSIAFFFFQYRESPIVLISFLVSSLDIRDIYKAEIILEGQ